MDKAVNRPFYLLVKGRGMRRKMGGCYAEKGQCKGRQERGRLCYSTVKSKI